MTLRSQAKADRRAAILDAAATMFARRGFNGSSIEDLGAAVGMSGPALYRHFASKQAVLGAVLVETSESLLRGGQDVVHDAPDAETALDRLIAFHVDFSISRSDVIAVQDRDLDSLSDDERRAVRTLQLDYVKIWGDVVRQLRSGLDEPEARVRVQAAFGLMNSTPHSLKRRRGLPSAESARPLLETMTRAALLA